MPSVSDYLEAKRKLESGYKPPEMDERAEEELRKASTPIDVSKLEGVISGVSIDINKLPEDHPYRFNPDPRLIVALYELEQWRKESLHSNIIFFPNI